MRNNTSRVGGGIDLRRIAEAIAMPGIDSSCWLSLARVDDDHDAISLVVGTGWVVDVTFHGGKLDGIGPVPCRVASLFSTANEASSCPVLPGMEVLVALPGDGDPNDTPMIIAQLPNVGSSQFPTAIFGQAIDEDFARATFFIVTTKDLKLQFGSEARVDATDKAGIHAQAVTVADPEATQAYVRGNDFADALGSFLSSCGTLSNAVAGAFDALGLAATGPLAPLKVAFGTVAVAFAKWGGFTGVPVNGTPIVPFNSSAVGVLKAKLVEGQTLSKRIRGE